MSSFKSYLTSKDVLGLTKSGVSKKIPGGVFFAYANEKKNQMLPI